MNLERWMSVLLLLALPFGLAGSAWASFPEPDSLGVGEAQTVTGTSFTYQGRLELGGSPVTGLCDFKFDLYDAATSGSLLGSDGVSGVTVSEGHFTTQLDFGSSPFGGSTPYLEIAVDCGGNGFTTLDPRQPITAAPRALFASGAAWSGLTGVPAGFADDVDDDTTYSAGEGLSLDTTNFNVEFAGNGSASTVARSDHVHGGTVADCSTWWAPLVQDGTITGQYTVIAVLNMGASDLTVTASFYNSDGTLAAVTLTVISAGSQWLVLTESGGGLAGTAGMTGYATVTTDGAAEDLMPSGAVVTPETDGTYIIHLDWTCR